MKRIYHKKMDLCVHCQKYKKCPLSSYITRTKVVKCADFEPRKEALIINYL